MSQINTFFVPLSGNEAFLDEMNAFLRGHRVLQIEKAFTGNGWAFCAERGDWGRERDMDADICHGRGNVLVQLEGGLRRGLHRA